MFVFYDGRFIPSVVLQVCVPCAFFPCFILCGLRCLSADAVYEGWGGVWGEGRRQEANMVAPFYSVVRVSTKKHNELIVYKRNVIVMHRSDSGGWVGISGE